MRFTTIIPNYENKHLFINIQTYGYQISIHCMPMIFKIVQGYLTKESCKLGHKRIVKNLLASSKKNEMSLKKGIHV